MRIVNAPPPNFAAILAAFPHARNPGVMFTYGWTIYRLATGPIPSWLLEHERVHSKRQGDDPALWWARYIADPKFRFDEELIAHQVEWCSWLVAGSRNRAARRAQLHVIAARLSGPLYGRMVTLDDAKRLIQQGAIDAADAVGKAGNLGSAGGGSPDAPLAPV